MKYEWIAAYWTVTTTSMKLSGSPNKSTANPPVSPFLFTAGISLCDYICHLFCVLSPSNERMSAYSMYLTHFSFILYLEFQPKIVWGILYIFREIMDFQPKIVWGLWLAFFNYVTFYASYRHPERALPPPSKNGA